jgi:hypothetical protein
MQKQTPSSEKLTQAIRTNIGSLSPRAPYAALGSFLCEDEEQSLISLYVSSTKEYDNFGKHELLGQELTAFFGDIGNDRAASQKAALLVESLVSACLSGFQAETAWIAVRASNPTPQFNAPRWHADGYYFAPYDGEPKKMVLTLKGPGTRFALLPEAANPQSKILTAEVPEKYCSQAATLVPFIYIVGAEYAAIHSEPPIHEDRLFMSLVPGSAAQIAELRFQWNAKETPYS